MVLVVLVAGACSGDDADSTTTPPITTATSAPTPTTIAEPADTTPTTIAPGLPSFGQDSINPGQQQAYSFVSDSGVEIEYLLFVPEGYAENGDLPLIVFLHGNLGRTDQTLERLGTLNPLVWVDPNAEFPFVMVAPKGPDGLWSQYHEPMDELFDVLGEVLPINPEALFLTGPSTGAVGTWQWALARPDRFAGIAPIAGGPSMSTEEVVPEDICRLVNLPIWVAHSRADDLPIDSHEATVTELQQCGSTAVVFTVYEDLGHTDSYQTAYAGPDLYEWMLKQVP